jgi:hypothetical protein
MMYYFFQWWCSMAMLNKQRAYIQKNTDKWYCSHTGCVSVISRWFHLLGVFPLGILDIAALNNVDRLNRRTYTVNNMLDWLVVWNIFYFSIYWECHHPNWRTHIFQKGLNHQPDSRYCPGFFSGALSYEESMVIAIGRPCSKHSPPFQALYWKGIVELPWLFRFGRATELSSWIQLVRNWGVITKQWW